MSKSPFGEGRILAITAEQMLDNSILKDLLENTVDSRI